MSHMKAVGYIKSLPISEAESLMDIELPMPIASGRDVLVQVRAIAVNPVDYKIRLNVPSANGEPKVIGWDAVGEVVATGELVSNFKTGDVVYYAGDLNRQGSNAEYQLVDERIVGFKPKSLSNAEAAALPLTTITAWELLFERLTIKQQKPVAIEKTNEVLLVTGAAGGVGSILIQLAKAITGATVIATASRESSIKWVKQLGADYVVDHTKPLAPQIAELVKHEGIAPVSHIASLNGTEAYFDSYIELLAPFGKIALIDDPSEPLDVMKLKPKSQSIHFELMYTRSMFQTPDMAEQSKLLNRVAELIDTGYVKTTVGQNFGRISAVNLRTAHELLETGQAIGKVVLEDF